MGEIFTFWNAQKLYVAMIYGWTLYVYADSYYSTARRVYRLANGTYWVSSSAYNMIHEWRKPVEVELQPVTSMVTNPIETVIELGDIKPVDQVVHRIETPCIIDNFTGEISTENKLPLDKPKLVRQNGVYKNTSQSC